MSDKKQNDSNKYTTQFAELRQKYTVDVKPIFPITAASYNKNEIEKQINDIKKEIKEEIALSLKLDNNVEERIIEAKNFMQDNKDIIENQFKELCELEEQLFNIVEENNKRKELDKEYYELMKSQKFMDLGNTMRNMKEKIKRVNNFLVENGKKNYLE